MVKEDQEKDFYWGVSSAAYQTEGAYNIEGKGLSIWDVFTNTKGKIRNNENANTACDFYNRYQHDIALINYMRIPNFRFSISWSRIMPEGTGKINYKGIDFYNKVIDACLENNVTPWITLYHWDLPQALEKKGGWTNREILFWFEEYVAICIKHFGDRVKHWMVLNEPMVFTGAGYFLGIHAPGRKGVNNFLAAVHHAALCQAQGARIIRSMNAALSVGTTFSTSLIQPFSNSINDQLAAVRVDALVNRLFIEPLLGLGYPLKDLKFLQRIERYVKQDDEKLLQHEMDFIGIQNYTREIISHSWLMPFIKAKVVKADKRNVPTTLMNWEVYPECIYEILHKFNKYNNIKELIVTENGAAFNDLLQDGGIDDKERINYLQKHINQVMRAKSEGVNVKGYFVWSLTDNFEWAEGYLPRFGLTHIDFKSQKRTIKNSGIFYKNVMEMSGKSGVLF